MTTVADANVEIDSLVLLSSEIVIDAPFVLIIFKLPFKTKSPIFFMLGILSTSPTLEHLSGGTKNKP